MSIKKFYNLGKNELFPICRSITGNGVRKTLKIIKKYFPKLKVYEVPSGTKVFDWNVPPEWNINDAYVIDKNNKKIIDFKKNNLHLVGYSMPINKILTKKNYLKIFIHCLNNQQQFPILPHIIKSTGAFVSIMLKKFFLKSSIMMTINLR